MFPSNKTCGQSFSFHRSAASWTKMTTYFRRLSSCGSWFSIGEARGEMYPRFRSVLTFHVIPLA
ncbi:MAG: hypothetical protein ACTS4V_00885 [Candidatus Hodgkinia cicadicola]